MNTKETRVAHSGEFRLSDSILPIVPDITVTSIGFDDRRSMLPVAESSLEGVRSSPFDGFYYGGVGTPTTEALSQAIARLEGGVGAVLTPSGQSAIALLIFCKLGSGDHVLISDGLTYTTQWLFDDLARKLNFTISRFRPSDVSRLDALMTPRTRLIFAEIPSSVVFEICDIAPMVEAGKSRAVPVVMDTTWSASHYLDAFALGVDATVVSLTKMHAGVQGVSMGALVTKTADGLGAARSRAALLGLNVSPSACAKASAAIVTLSARLAFQEVSLRLVLDAICGHPKVRRIFQPSVADDDNQMLWRRYFTGAVPLFSIEMRRDDLASVEAVIDHMRLIKRGYGWGGPTGLCQPMQRPGPPSANWLLRIYLGLEHGDDLALDLVQALGAGT
jgi:cystathionine beta-lyase